MEKLYLTQEQGAGWRQSWHWNSNGLCHCCKFILALAFFLEVLSPNAEQNQLIGTTWKDNNDIYKHLVFKHKA